MTSVPAASFTQKLIPKFTLLAAKGHALPVHGNGRATRSYLYVEDVAEAFDVILHRGADGQTYNIGTQEERSVLDVAHDVTRSVAAYLGRPSCSSEGPTVRIDVRYWGGAHDSHRNRNRKSNRMQAYAGTTQHRSGSSRTSMLPPLHALLHRRTARRCVTSEIACSTTGDTSYATRNWSR